MDNNMNEKDKNKKSKTKSIVNYTMSIFIIAIFLMAIICILSLIGLIDFDKLFEKYLPFTSLIMVSGLVSSLYFDSKEKKEQTEMKNNEFFEIMKNSAEGKDNVIDIFNLTLNNMNEIKEFYRMSKSQAKQSFILSIVMSIFGFVFLTISIGATFIIKTENYIPLIISAICSALIELIAATALMVHKKSLEQLNLYYKSLHNNERFLLTLGMISKISSEKRDDMYCEIIRSQFDLISGKIDNAKKE